MYRWASYFSSRVRVCRLECARSQGTLELQTGQRKLLMGSLVAAFAVQTYLVYTDATANDTAPLHGAAIEGQSIWRRHNCQSCHQIYGFGGFLGPDLTNAADRLPRETLDEILTEGRSPMPAFHFSDGEIDALEAYLHALDATGIGQARRAPPVDRELLRAAIETQARETPPTEAAMAGMRTFGGACSACHTLFQPTPLGPFVAPDLSAVTERVPPGEIDRLLAEGRLTRGMPASGLSPAARREVVSYLEWIASHREVLMPPGSGETDALPWWEFR